MPITMDTPMLPFGPDLPRPSKAHATCAWCGAAYSQIVDLLDHVDAHLPR